jgi:hypothetical protein
MTTLRHSQALRNAKSSQSRTMGRRGRMDPCRMIVPNIRKDLSIQRGLYSQKVPNKTTDP